MDHFAIARGHAVADTASFFRHDHAVSAQGERAGSCQSHNAGTDDENVHTFLMKRKRRLESRRFYTNHDRRF
jgi:hypothetical protein